MTCRNMLWTFTILICALGGSCSLFDSGIEWKDGNYALLWIDVPDDVALDYSKDGKGWSPLIERRVFAVGSDLRYIVVKQHPGGDKARTNYYLIDKAKDEFHCVQGPMGESEFLKRKQELGLPQFTKILDSLQ